MDQQLKKILHFHYIVLGYQYPHLIRELISTLNSENSTFWIHIDAKVNINPFLNILRPLKCDVRLLPRTRISWGGPGIPKVTITALKLISKETTAEYYCSLLSEQDFPVKRPSDIRRKLTQRYPYSYIEYFKLPTKQWIYQGTDRYERWNFYLPWLGRVIVPHRGIRQSRISKLFAYFIGIALPPKRAAPTGIEVFYGGSTYWTISNKLSEYLLIAITQQPEYLKFFDKCWIPEEILIHTIALNGPYNTQSLVINNNLRYLVWESENSSHPEILNEKHLTAIRNSEALFARKFSENSSSLKMQIKKSWYVEV